MGLHLRTIRLFNIKEQIKLVIGLILLRVLNYIKPFEDLKLQKYYLDHLFDIGYLIECKKDSLFYIHDKQLSVHIRKNTSDYKVFEQIFGLKEYKPLVDIISSLEFSSKIKVIIDAGANIGFTSIFLHHFFPQAHKYAIEPYPPNIEVMQENLEMNIPSANYTISEAAIWNKNKSLWLGNDFRDGKEWAKNVTENDPNSNYDKMVNGVTILKYLNDNRIDEIDILKVDIEGAEKEVFLEDENIKSVLKKTKLIAIEIHNECYNESDMINLLRNENFALKRVNETLFGVNQNVFSNFDTYAGII